MDKNQDVQHICDAGFLQQVKDKSLDPKHFSHMGHLRLAWLVLKKKDVDTASQTVCMLIKDYAESLGATTKFNLTLTDAFVRIMAKRCAQSPSENWEQFLASNQDLITDAIGVLGQHFSQEILTSEDARTSLIAPDIAPI